MNRRGFLQTCLILTTAPAIVRADSLMRIVLRDTLVLLGNGIHDDTAALQAYLDGKSVLRSDGQVFRGMWDGARYRLTAALTIARNGTLLQGGTSTMDKDCPAPFMLQVDDGVQNFNMISNVPFIGSDNPASILLTESKPKPRPGPQQSRLLSSLLDRAGLPTQASRLTSPSPAPWPNSMARR